MYKYKRRLKISLYLKSVIYPVDNVCWLRVALLAVQASF